MSIFSRLRGARRTAPPRVVVRLADYANRRVPLGDTAIPPSGTQVLSVGNLPIQRHAEPTQEPPRPWLCAACAHPIEIHTDTGPDATPGPCALCECLVFASAAEGHPVAAERHASDTDASPNDNRDTDRCDRVSGLALLLSVLDPHGVTIPDTVPDTDTVPDDCPTWCGDHLSGPDGGAHRCVVAFLPRVDTSVHVALATAHTGRPVVVIVPPPARPTPDDLAELCAVIVRALDLARSAFGTDDDVPGRDGEPVEHAQGDDAAPEVTQ